MDRLSELPDSLIHIIFSFLPMEYVVRTAILSKRWKDLWISVPFLNFYAKTGDLCKFGYFVNRKRCDKFRNFVNRTLILWRGTKIQKLTFHLGSMFDNDKSLYCDHNLWVLLALQHKVEELYLDHYFNGGTGCWMPQRLFSCSSIRNLRLIGCDLEIPGKLQWDQLKCLEIDNNHLSQFVIDKVLLGSPRLEIFRVRCRENLNIYSTSLKMLSIRYGAEDYYYHHDVGVDEIDSTLKIWTPNLEELEIFGSVWKKCLLVNAPSLIEATLHFYHPTCNYGESLSDYELCGKMLREFFQSIHPVKKLVVRDWCIKVMAVMKKTDLPSPLLNLKCLTLDTRFGKLGLAGIVNLLKISPNLVMLAIQNSGTRDYKELGRWKGYWNSLIPRIEFSDSLLMNLRIVEIKLFDYDSSIFSMAKFLLKNASALEKIVVTVQADTPYVLLRATRKLLRMPRSSPNAEAVLRQRQ